MNNGNVSPPKGWALPAPTAAGPAVSRDLLPAVPSSLLGKRRGGAVRAHIISLAVGPVVLRQILDVLDVLCAPAPVVERIVVGTRHDASVMGELCTHTRNYGVGTARRARASR